MKSAIKKLFGSKTESLKLKSALSFNFALLKSIGISIESEKDNNVKTIEI